MNEVAPDNTTVTVVQVVANELHLGGVWMDLCCFGATMHQICASTFLYGPLMRNRHSGVGG